MNHWICIQLKGDRIYAGNPGYQDHLGHHYEYDSSVGNHLRVASGDILVLRDRSAVLGIGQSDAIGSEQGQKRRFRCPTCGITQIQARKRRQFRFRCAEGHEFDVASEEAVPCTIFRAQYRQPFLHPQSPLDTKTIRQAELRPSDQAAIARANLGLVLSELRRSCPEVDGLLDRASLAAQLSPDTATESIEETAFQLAGLDSRERALREIRLRRGGRVFRQRMLRRFKSCCAISGCNVVDLLEAAHIKPYRGEQDNHPANGLLLRSDLHTLFDLHLMGIRPIDLTVAVHPSLLKSEYAVFNGRPLRVPGPRTLARAALEARWAAFTARSTIESDG